MEDFLVLGILFATLLAAFMKKSLKVIAITAGSVDRFSLTSSSLLITFTVQFLLLLIDFRPDQRNFILLPLVSKKL